MEVAAGDQHFFETLVARYGYDEAVLHYEEMRERARIAEERNRADSRRDVEICGVSLEESVASPYADSHGAVDSISTPYGSLEVMLGRESFSRDDVLLDVGCGKGRPLAYLASIGFPGKLVGIEINSLVADFANGWAESFPNIEIYSGDVFDANVDSYTAFFMYYAMFPEVFVRFIEKIEKELTHPARLYSLSDEGSGDFMDKRSGWSLLRRDWIYKVNGVIQHGQPERYSVWQYRPPC